MAGEKGKSGTHGIQGIAGRDGSDGKDGKQGKRGEQWKCVATGARGKTRAIVHIGKMEKEEMTVALSIFKRTKHGYL